MVRVRRGRRITRESGSSSEGKTSDKTMADFVGFELTWLGHLVGQIRTYVVVVYRSRSLIEKLQRIKGYTVFI